MALLTAAVLAFTGCSSVSPVLQSQPSLPASEHIASERDAADKSRSRPNRRPADARRSSAGSDRDAAPGDRAPNAGIERATEWEGIYALGGNVDYSPSLPWSDYDLPDRMDVQFTGRRSLLFYAETEPEPGLWYGVGMILELATRQGDAIKRLSLIAPNQGGGTVTFGFVLENDVEWLSLQPGETSAAQTKDRTYVLSITRTDEAEWMMAVSPNGDAEPDPWFDRGFVNIKASSPRPPWNHLTIDFETSNSQSSSSGHLELQRQVR
ncbi:MAG TPA: hypothetical protein VIG64_03120 [Actinomycetota bacterium]|jgi:hypothetical protein